MTAMPLTHPEPPVVAPVSDEALVGRLRGGDASAGEELVRRFHTPLMRYLTRLGGSEQLAEELHQQAWLSVLDHLSRFDVRQPGGFKAWLFRIATNKANDYWRSSGRERSAKQGLRLVTEDAAPESSQRLEGTEQQAKLRRAIEQLPEPQRQVVLLRYYSGMKFTEIAKTVGCPLNTALGRMHKATLKLREMMG